MSVEPVSIRLFRQDPAGEGFGEWRSLGASGQEDSTFSGFIEQAIRSVDEMNKESDGKVEAVLAGKAENIHEVMIAMEKARLSFQLMVEIRNRAVETYQELSRMQI